MSQRDRRAESEADRQICAKHIVQTLDTATATRRVVVGDFFTLAAGQLQEYWGCVLAQRLVRRRPTIDFVQDPQRGREFQSAFPQTMRVAVCLHARCTSALKVSCNDSFSSPNWSKRSARSGSTAMMTHAICASKQPARSQQRVMKCPVPDMAEDTEDLATSSAESKLHGLASSASETLGIREILLGLNLTCGAVLPATLATAHHRTIRRMHYIKYYCLRLSDC